MKKIILNIMAAAALVAGFSACSDSLTDEDRANSIFDTNAPQRSEFDEWILKNFTYPYNVQVTYKLNDIETDPKYTVVPADSAKAAKLAKVVKYMWFDAYDELVGSEFLKTYSPRMLMMIGSAEYQSHGTMILGYASGSIKIVLCNVNALDDDRLRDATDELTEYFLSTLHHEFTHILNQKNTYDKAFEQISEGDYVSGNWYQESNSTAYSKGFVRNYAMQEPNEDFAETLADYIVYTDSKWATIKAGAGDNFTKIEEKIAFIRSYMMTSYGIDIDKLREIVQRRASELKYLNLDTLD